MANSNLTSAKKAKNDEFYTQYHDIEKEIGAYVEYNPDVFKDKTILMPCDDPEWSNFTKFFAQNFERLGIKKLISTSYAPDSKLHKNGYQPTLFETKDPQFDAKKTITNGKIFTLEQDKSGDGKIDVDDLEWTYLKGDGDFNSKEIKKLRDEADIIITNPPFSLFRDFLAWIIEADKQYVLIGSMNAITYKEVFKLLKEDKMWLGNGFQSGNAFFSSSSTKAYAAGVYNQETGLVKFRNCCWYTCLDHGKRHQPFELMSMEENLKFSRHKNLIKNGYLKYDNYNAIDIPFTDAIPNDYSGIMGVPISFLDKYSPEQFEIVGSDNDIKEGKLPHLIKSKWTGKLDRGYINGNRIYSRIFIQHKKNK